MFIWLFCFPEKWADGLTISSAAPVQFQGNCGADSEPFHSWLERKGSRRFPGNGPFPGNGSFSPLFQEMVQETPSLPRLVQLWGSFRAVSRQLQSNFRAISEQFPGSFPAILEQFQGSFRAVSGQFGSSFRAVSEQFQSNFRAVSEQFQSNFRAVSEQF